MVQNYLTDFNTVWKYSRASISPHARYKIYIMFFSFDAP
mgnify:CR=1 FL=1